MAEQSRRRINLRNIDEHARAKGDGVETITIAPHSRFGFRAASEIVPNVIRKIAPRHLDNFLIADKVQGHCSPSWAVYAGSVAQFILVHNLVKSTRAMSQSSDTNGGGLWIAMLPKVSNRRFRKSHFRAIREEWIV